MIGPLPYIGGKTRLSRAIIAMLPPHRTYVEVFGGGAQILFRKQHSEVEVINDIDDDIVNFFRILREHPEEFARCLQLQLNSRTWFHLWQRKDPATLTDVQRAARFYMLQKSSFGGLVRNRAYHYFVQKRPTFNPLRVREIAQAVHSRLAHVQIEALPFEKIFEKFDSPETVFLADPPYYERKLYNHNFSPADFQRLVTVLGAVRGKFILTVSDQQEMRAMFQEFRLHSTQLVYSAKQNATKAYPELIITNFIPATLPPTVQRIPTSDAHDPQQQNAKLAN